MIYPLLCILSLACISEGCAPHSPKRRPPRPQPPITPMMCPLLPVDSACTDSDCKPVTNNQMEITCPTSGNVLLVVVDASNGKKAATEAKCDSGKWAFKNGNTPVTIEATKVYCSTQCEVDGNCEIPCAQLTSAVSSCPDLLETFESRCSEPSKNDLKEVTCSTPNDAIFVVDAGDMYKEVSEAKCDAVTGKWEFSKGSTPVSIDATKVFCSQACVETANCQVNPCSKFPDQVDPADLENFPDYCFMGQATCGAPTENTATSIKCPADFPVLNVWDKVSDTTVQRMTEFYCDTNEGKWVLKDGANKVEPTSDNLFCSKT